MTAISTIEPDSITKGDSVIWRKSLADYPATSWTLTYYIRGAAALDITATADGSAYVISISAAQTDTLSAGDYWWQAVATSGAQQVTVASGVITVRPSLSDLAAGYDGRSHVKKVLDALEATLEDKATLDQLSYSIQGRSLSKMSPEDLYRWRDKYARMYAQELEQQRIARGLKSRRKVQIRFNS